MEQAFANALHGGSIDALRAAARLSSEPKRTFEPTRRYNALEEAIANWEAHRGELPAQVEADLWKRAAHTGAGKTIDLATANHWIKDQLGLHEGRTALRPAPAHLGAEVPKVRRRRR